MADKPPSTALHPQITFPVNYMDFISLELIYNRSYCWFSDMSNFVVLFNAELFFFHIRWNNYVEKKGIILRKMNVLFIAHFCLGKYCFNPDSFWKSSYTEEKFSYNTLTMPILTRIFYEYDVLVLFYKYNIFRLFIWSCFEIGVLIKQKKIILVW